MGVCKANKTVIQDSLEYATVKKKLSSKTYNNADAHPIFFIP